MPRAKSFLSAGLMIGCFGLLGYAGKKAGEQLACSGILQRSAPAEKPRSADTGLRGARAREPVRAELVAASIKRLNALSDGSPRLQSDWEALAQMDGVLARLNAAELAEVFAGVVRPGDENFYLLASKIGAVWMAKDPDAAMKAVLEIGKSSRWGRHLAGSVFGSWLQEEPEAALAWLDSAELPEGPPPHEAGGDFEAPAIGADLKGEFRRNALMNLVERDFSLASAEFLKMERPVEGVDDYSNLMGLWGHEYADDPLKRGQLVEFAKATGRPEDYAALNHDLLKAWPQEDALGMMNYLNELRGYLESDAVPAAARQQVDGTAVAAAIFREYDRPALEWWMERYGQCSETPAPMREAMARWAQKYPDAMLGWFEEQPPSPQRDALASSVVPSLMLQKKFTEAAGTIATVQDPGSRQAAIERLDFLWREQDAEAAAAWQAGLPLGTLAEPGE
ncbi:hypothetical protein [Luteolibacter sp. Populi]|uniref:hypothetical protein n=1 Tax=Luteolibacter sp. Populi TaxID=3230487 RepID=UPI003465FC34